MSSPDTFIEYFDGVEHAEEHESAEIQKITDALSNVQHKVEDKSNHALRMVHSKSHGLLKGEIQIYPNLPDQLRQGLFENPSHYGVMLRFSTSPAGISPDRIGGVRGVGLKIIGVVGPKVLAEPNEAVTQDFLFVNHPTFPAKDSKAFLVQAQVLDKIVSNLPEAVQIAQNTAARAVGEVARHVGLDPISTAVGLTKKETNILGDTFYTGVPIRYGKYMAKLALRPLSPNLQPFIDGDIDTSVDDVLRKIVIDFFSSNSAEYELQVQLCTSLDTMPIEDPSVRWPEADSPYVGVAKVSFPIQNAWSEQRQKYGEDVLTFNPWHALETHRPLGSIMRTRRVAYETSSKYRHSKTGATRVEPTNVNEMPD